MIGSKIRQRRKALKLTQDDLATRLNVDKQTVYRYEKNENTPSLEVLARMAVELEVTADWLLGLVDEPNSRISASDLTEFERRLIDAIRQGELADAMQAALGVNRLVCRDGEVIGVIPMPRKSAWRFS